MQTYSIYYYAHNPVLLMTNKTTSRDRRDNLAMIPAKCLSAMSELTESVSWGSGTGTWLH